MEYSESTIAPDIFRLWSGIALLAGALERRCWARVGEYKTFPNLFTVFVARPAVGKYVIEDVNELWRSVKKPGKEEKAFSVAPSNMTKASLLDALADARKSFLPPAGPPVENHSMLIAAEEMAVMMPRWDTEFIGVLNKIWNNPPVHSETRRTGRVLEIVIPEPQLNILTGVQPGWLSSAFPPEAWSTGLTSRMILVYAAHPPDKDIFSSYPLREAKRTRLLAHLSAISSLYGEWTIEPDVIEILRSYGRGDKGPLPVPFHSKLENYVPRRTLHLIKIMLVSAVARDPLGRLITTEDLNRSQVWLLEAESLMPDIFRAMLGKSDREVIEELHYHLSNLYALSGNKPVHEGRVWDFLSERVPSERVGKIVEVALMSDIITKEAGEPFYRPRPVFSHRGIE